VGAEFTDVTHQIADDSVHFDAVQLAVRIVEHGSAADVEDGARFSKLLPSERGQFVIVFGLAAMGGSLTGSKADDGRFHASVAVKVKSAAEGAGFVVGMSGHCEQSHHHHGVILSGIGKLRRKD
jgi:hypothetical protein